MPPWLERKIALVNPKLIIPIDRLAIGLFFDTSLPLPHPSGASTWMNKPEKLARMKKAIKLIRKQRELLGL